MRPPCLSHEDFEVFATAGFPGVNRVDAGGPKRKLNFGEALAVKFEAEDFAATLTELGEAGVKMADQFALLGFENDVDVVIGDGFFRDVDCAIFATAGRLAGMGDELEAGNLQSQRDEFGDFGDVSVFFMEHEQNLLCDVFGELSPITRCREGENPFTQSGENIHNVRIEEAPWK